MDNQIVEYKSAQLMEDPAQIRARVVKCRNDFKSSWRNLAQALYVVWKDKYYKEWGYELFDHYVAKEVFIRKNTAMKLIRSYRFLEEEEPGYLAAQAGEDQDQESAPAFEDVEVLRKAKKNLDQGEYEKIRNDLFIKGKDRAEVKKELTSLIRERKQVDPEEERLKQQMVTIKRFTSTLKSLKREIQILKLLPVAVIKDIDLLLERLEEATGND